MSRTLPLPSATLVGSIALAAAGVAVNDGSALSVRTVPALLLIVPGVAGVTSSVADASVARLERTAKRWWTAAFVTFLPYGLATAPAIGSAAAVGSALDGPVVLSVVEALAGASLLCAVAVTVLYGFARYGLHPGRPTPEERILDDHGRE